MNQNFTASDQNQTHIEPACFLHFKSITAAQSTRRGGVSPHPFASLNLGLHTEDQAENVRKNRRRLFSALDIDPANIAHSFQVHGDQILVADHPGAYEGYDALMTNRPDIFCCVTIADCTPILVYDPENRAVAAIHAGWRGSAREIVRKAIAEMQKAFGTKGKDCRAYIGACISECAYEVGEEVAQHFHADFHRFDPEKQKYYLDLKAANKSQLLAVGLPESQIEVSPHCTVQHNDRFFSHRQEKGKTGRMLAIIGMKE